MSEHLQPVLPPGQHRVRYFGWMRPAAKARRAKVATLLAVPILERAKAEEPVWHLRCPRGARFTLPRVGILLASRTPAARVPPSRRR